MDEQDWLAERFERQRGHLRRVAYRMLGSLSEADDAVQEAWLRNMLRSRRRRAEEPHGSHDPRRLTAWHTAGGR